MLDITDPKTHESFTHFLTRWIHLWRKLWLLENDFTWKDNETFDIGHELLRSWICNTLYAECSSGTLQHITTYQYLCLLKKIAPL